MSEKPQHFRAADLTGTDSDSLGDHWSADSLVRDAHQFAPDSRTWLCAPGQTGARLCSKYLFSVGSAGDPPASFGDPLNETEARSRVNGEPICFREPTAIPSGESPDGTGESPVLPGLLRLVLRPQPAPTEHTTRWPGARAFWRWCVALLLLGIALAVPVSSARAAQFTEAQVKAAYLFQFGSLVEWPAKKLAPKDRLVIGVVGNSAVAAELERRARTNEISSHRVVVRRLVPNADFSECHILFIGQEHDAAAILNHVKAPGVLTVGEHERFAAVGGVLNFVFVEGAVQYQANLDAAEKARVQLNSKLINVARQRGMIIHTAKEKESR